MIPIGSLCYLIRTEPGNEHMLGRVVTVVSGLQQRPERPDAWFHQVDAAWLRAERPRTCVFAPPSALRPIAGPDQSSPAPHRHVPELA